MVGRAPIIFGVLLGDDGLFEGSVATIEFPQEAVSCAFAETFSLFLESLNVGLGASEENDFDHGLPRRTLALTTSQGVPCEGSFW
jgi:hypothetical protein